MSQVQMGDEGENIAPGMASDIGNKENQVPFKVVGGILFNVLELLAGWHIGLPAPAMPDEQYIPAEHGISTHMILMGMGIYNDLHRLAQYLKCIQQGPSQLPETGIDQHQSFFSGYDQAIGGVIMFFGQEVGLIAQPDHLHMFVGIYLLRKESR